MKVLKRTSSKDTSKLLFTSIIVLFTVSLFSSQIIAQNCNSELKVLKNRNARSVAENDGTQFTFQLINNATSAQTYTIRTEMSNKVFKVKGKVPKRLGPNQNLTRTVLKNRAQIQYITVPAGATVTFQVQVTVPPNTPVNHWGGIDVTATSDMCPNNNISTLLRLYVSDASAE